MKAKKSLGQNFLKDNNILSKIVDCGEITNTDIVLEIGPGTGNLTEKILEKKEINSCRKRYKFINSIKKKFWE